jgi:hypothetical protein
MAVRWTVRSEEVHRSKATWVGEKPRDGGKSLLDEAFEFIHKNQQPGRLVVDFGIGGSVSMLEFEQKGRVPSPPAEFDAEDDDLPIQ